MSMSFRRTAVISSIFAIWASAVSAATVLNGSFEDIGVQSLNTGGWSHFPSIPGWTGVPNVEIQSNKTLGSIDAHHGDQYVELDTNQDASIYQDIWLTSGTYKLSFWYSPRVNNLSTSTNDMLYSVGAGSALLSGTINGAPNPDYPHGAWTNVTGIFVVDAAKMVRLMFTASGGSHYSGCGNCGALIDKVSISAIPVPASGLLLLGAFAVLSGARLRQTKPL